MHARGLSFQIVHGILTVVVVLCASATVSFGQGQAFVRDESAIGRDIDYYHEAISLRVRKTAENLDEFFADERSIEESNETQVRVHLALRQEDGGNPTVRLSLRGRIVMPYLRERLQVFIDTDGRERDVRDQLSETADVTADDKSIFAGLRYVTRETRRSRVSIDGGLRWRGGLVPFVRARARRHWTLDEWLIRGTQQFFWFSDRGFGETSTVDFERTLDADHFFRSSTSGTWSEVSNGIDWQQRFALFNQLAPDQVLGLELKIEGHTRPNTHVSKYEGTLRWRKQGHRDWLIYEVAPALLFPRENDFTLTPLITLRVEIVFGDPLFL